MKRRKVRCPRCFREWRLDKKDQEPILHRCGMDGRIRPVEQVDR